MTQTTTRKIGIIAAVLTALALTVTMVAAGNAHFVGTPSLGTSGNTASASGKIAGLGNIDQVYVSVTGDAQCVNRGNKNPEAGNKQTVGAGAQVPVQNGKANFSIGLSASFQPNCSPPMRIVWSNLTVSVYLTDANGDPTGDPILTYP